MKLAAGQVAGVLRDTVQFTGLLLYGEDFGLVRDRAQAAVRGVLGGDDSPFRTTVLTREEHNRLRDEAASLALGGGRRVVRVQDATDGLVPALSAMKHDPADTLIVLEGGELTPRSKLRAFAEKHPTWAAIACYASNAAGVAAEIRAALGGRGISATPDALAFLSDELAGESVTRRAELEKLALFAADRGEVDLDTAQRSCAVSMEASLASAVAAALGGRIELCDALLDQLGHEGTTGPGLLAVLSNQVQRLLKVRLLVDAGESPEQACRALMPPIYPRQLAGFLQDVQRWRAASLEALGRAIRDADMACKRAASPDFSIASRLLATVASRAPTR